MNKELVSKQNLSKIALKSSMYHLLTLFILKFGGLIFTIIIARMLLPELFGIYALALSIVTIAMVFTDLGIDITFLRYLSDSIGKKRNAKSKSYFLYLIKFKSFLIFFVIVSLILFSKFISYNIYQKPLLFYPLIFSCLFIISESFRGFMGQVFTAKKDFKTPVFFHAFFQISKIVLSILAILFLTESLKVQGIFIAFFFSSLFTLALTFFILLKKDRHILFGKTEKINKSKINYYWKFMILTSISVVFFGSIDMLMLGRFVDAEYLGYYRAAISLVITLATLFSLSGVFLPIFTQIHGKRFSRGFHKIFRYMLILFLPATIGSLFIADYLIKVTYGNEYLLGITSFYLLTPLIITTPLIELYSLIFQSKEKPKIVSNAVFISLLVNIILNSFIIFLFLGNSLLMMAGVGLATSLSRIILLGILIVYAKNKFNLGIRDFRLKSPIFATFVMTLFLIAFNSILDMNSFLVMMEIILGAGVYFMVLFLAGGLVKEDWELIKSLLKR